MPHQTELHCQVTKRLMCIHLHQNTHFLHIGHMINGIGATDESESFGLYQITEAAGKVRRKSWEWKRIQSKGNLQPEATATASLPTGECARLSTVCMIQRHLWECNLSRLPVSPIHSCPFYNPPLHLSPLYQRDWLLRKWGFSVTQNHTSLTGGAHTWILSPPLPPRPLGFKGRGLCGGQVWRLSWRPDSAWWTFLYEIWKHGAWRTFLL